MAFIKDGFIFIEVTVSSPEPDILIVLKSAAKLNRSPKSEGLIGAASTFIKTSLSDGIGFSTVVIDISIFPSLVTFDLICFEFLSDIITLP